MGDGRRWRCLRRRSRPVCLTRSATVNRRGEGRKYLCSTIAWDWSSGIIPQALVRSSDWFLVVMIGVSCSECSTGKEAQQIAHHDGRVAVSVNGLIWITTYTSLSIQYKEQDG